MYSSSNERNTSVYQLLTELCDRNATKYCSQSRISQKRIISKMRSLSYEIILKKNTKLLSIKKREPLIDLLTYYFVLQQNVKNIAEYKRSMELKKYLDKIRKADYGEHKENVYNVLRLLAALTNTVKADLSTEMYQRPFTFGLLDEMLPKLPCELFGSPQPYPYFPSHIFDLPFSLKNGSTALNNPNSQTYTVERWDSRSFLPDKSHTQQISGPMEVKTFLSPMSLASLTSTHISPYSDNSVFNYPRLVTPRDLQIPTSQPADVNVKVSFTSTGLKSDFKEVYRANADDVDIWELATQVDKNVPDDIWEIVSKLPPLTERQLISSSAREMRLWHQTYRYIITDLNIISEKQFIRHVMYLIIGVETSTFPFSEDSSCFYMRDNCVLEGITKENLEGYVSDLLIVGTYYRRLYKFGFNQTLEDHFHSNGLVYEAAREVIRRYLLDFRLLATKIYEDCYKIGSEDLNCMPTLLQILYHIGPLKYEIETIVSIYKLTNSDSRTSLPLGAELMSYLFNEISLITHEKTAFTMFNALFSICKVYFKFIERFIFEGELDDRYNEFFIRKDFQFVNCRSKKYWDKGFHITQSVAVPEFLRALAKFILLCGKSLRLLKLCNPCDPLVLLISSDHPSVKCCATFDELERQQQVLDVYRTRCLFVTGELVTFDQILLKREAERKAFTEMASQKQAETMEKIVAERKRLAQLIIAEKQHSLRILEAAMAEAKAAKMKAKQRDRIRYDLEVAVEKATEEVDSKLRNNETNKIMEYYSKLNMEVEKSKIHTEWKIKRLQLDQSRIQLLSSEERNLKREKLELEHQKNEEAMAMSIQSLDTKSEDELEINIETTKNIVNENKVPTVSSSEIVIEQDNSQKTEDEKNLNKSHTTSDVFSAVCNLAKSFFGVTKYNDDKKCDNEKVLDFQGNIITDDINDNRLTKSSDVIGSKLDQNNVEYEKSKQEALLNKQKVMTHEFGYTDRENNEINPSPLITIACVDEENNIQDNWTFMEAKRNKTKALGSEFNNKQEAKSVLVEPRTDAQKEALINKQKVLGVEYNLPAKEIFQKEPSNVAQEEALRNRNKILTSGMELNNTSPKRESAKRSGLTLNLKPCIASTSTLGSGTTFKTGVTTPGDLFPGLDLETPTTADIPFEGQITSDTPRSEEDKNLNSNKSKSDKEFLTSEGFNFSIIDEDEAADSEIVCDMHIDDSMNDSPAKNLEMEIIDRNAKNSFFNILDGTYSLENFDPFGVKELKNYSVNHFSNRMDLEMKFSWYTHPSVTMAEVKKKPYANIFASRFSSEDENEEKITCDNIATLTACLQRSVMLPLTYQLEVVNNSILTHFLVNLDMYEHLRSLKDYFFLMDGEFSRSICNNLFTKLVKTLNPQELLNFATLHNILDKALGSSISHIHKFSENLSFTITEPPLSFQHSSPDVLQCLSLTYSVNWPLNIILSQEALMRYAKVFQFLIKMRRIFWVLGEDFENLKLSVKLTRQHSRRLLKSPQYISVQVYRHIMASMIRALDNYIVTTCILSSWTEFENELKKARTLDDLYDCHVAYIKKVLFRCLLNNRSAPVMKLLNELFTVILKFSRVLKSGEWQQNETNSNFTHSSFSQLEELFHLFEKLAKYLHKVITKLMECGYQRHLVELLTMINLNEYYDPDKSKEDSSSTQSN